MRPYASLGGCKTKSYRLSPQSSTTGQPTRLPGFPPVRSAAALQGGADSLNHGTMEQLRMEGTSKDHLVQPFVGKGA